MSRTVVALVTVLTGCVVAQEPQDPQPTLPGSIEVSWQVGPSDCDTAGVNAVEVEVGGITSTFACADGRGSLSVPPGTYEVTLFGLDEGGTARYSGTETGVVVRSNRVTEVPTVLLSALPAEIHVAWFFDNGRFCSHEMNKGVTEIEALLYDADDFVSAEVVAPCEDGELWIQDVRPGDYALTLVGRNDAGAITHRGDLDLPVEKGDFIDVEVTLVTQ